MAVLRGLSGYVLAAKNRWKGAASDGFHLICQQMSGRRPSSLNTFAFVLHHFRWTVSSLSSLQDFQRPANQNSCQEHKKPDRLLARIFSIPLVPHLARNFHIYIYMYVYRASSSDSVFNQRLPSVTIDRFVGDARDRAQGADGSRAVGGMCGLL